MTDHQLELGVAREEITPINAGYLAGDVLDTDLPVTQIHKALFAQSLFLTNGLNRLVLITVDVCKVSEFMFREVLSSLQNQLDLSPDQIMIAASHTHSAPQTIEADAAPGTFDEDFVTHVTNGMIASAVSSVKSTESVTLRYETGQSDLGVNKRLRTPWGVLMTANTSGDYDPEVGVLIAERAPGNPAAIVCCYASHPIGHLRSEISSDLTGFFRDEVESSFPDCMAFHVLGCAGDISPRMRWQGTSYEIGNPHTGAGRHLLPESQSKQFMETAGKELASIAISLTHAQTVPISPMVISTQISEIQLPLQDPLQETVFSAALSLPFSHRHSGWAKSMLDKLSRGETLPRTQSYSIQIWRISNQFCLIALEGEVFSSIGMQIKNAIHPKNCLIIGHANSYKGYIPTQVAIQEGGYEPESFYNVNLPAPYAPEMEKVLVGAITRVAKEQFLELESS
jgi:hypothetical protein